MATASSCMPGITLDLAVAQALASDIGIDAVRQKVCGVCEGAMLTSPDLRSRTARVAGQATKESKNDEEERLKSIAAYRQRLADLENSQNDTVLDTVLVSSALP